MVCVVCGGCACVVWCVCVKAVETHLDVLVVGQARGDGGEGVVVQVQLPQVRHHGQRAVLHHTDLVVAQTQPGENNSQ